MADIYLNKDILILTQVALKAFIDANKKLPKEEEWKDINKLVEQIWLNTRSNIKAIEVHSNNINSAEIHVVRERQGRAGSMIKPKEYKGDDDIKVDGIPF